MERTLQQRARMYNRDLGIASVDAVPTLGDNMEFLRELVRAAHWLRGRNGFAYLKPFFWPPGHRTLRPNDAKPSSSTVWELKANVFSSHCHPTPPKPPPSGSTATETDEVKKLAAAMIIRPSRRFVDAAFCLGKQRCRGTPSLPPPHRAARRVHTRVRRRFTGACFFVFFRRHQFVEGDQFVEGIASENLRERLLLEGSPLSFSRAVLLAQQLEQAAQQVRELVPGHVQQLTSRGGRFPRFNAAALVFPGTLSFP
ncbi:hypothetical protein MTO96_025325 [Rhipicephalus appendiculatus]